MAYLEPTTPGDFVVDPHEPPYSDTEREAAAWFRRMGGGPSALTGRADPCPHVTVCATLDACLEKMCWYRRYQRQIEAHLTTHGLQPHGR